MLEVMAFAEAERIIIDDLIAQGWKSLSHIVAFVIGPNSVRSVGNDAAHNFIQDEAPHHARLGL